MVQRVSRRTTPGVTECTGSPKFPSESEQQQIEIRHHLRARLCRVLLRATHPAPRSRSARPSSKPRGASRPLLAHPLLHSTVLLAETGLPLRVSTRVSAAPDRIFEISAPKLLLCLLSSRADPTPWPLSPSPRRRQSTSTALLRACSRCAEAAPASRSTSPRPRSAACASSAAKSSSRSRSCSSSRRRSRLSVRV
jgi:hypothetical protein